MIRPRSTMIFKILIKCLTFVSNAMLRVISTWSQKLYLREITPGWQEAIALTSHKHTCYRQELINTSPADLSNHWTPPRLTYIASKRPSVGVFHFCHGVHQGHKRHRCGFTLMHWIPMGYNAFWTNWNVPHYYCTQLPPPCFSNSIQFYRFNCRKYFVHKFFLLNQFQWISMLIVLIHHLWIFVRNKTTAKVAMSQNLFQKLINVHIPLYYGFISIQSVPCSDL